MRSASVAATLLLAAVTALTASCERPPVAPPGGDDPIPEGRVGPIALELFTQDRPAVGGKWYDYEPDGHTLTSKAQAWIVRDDAAAPDPIRHAAFRIASIYEPDAAESGLFTLELAFHDGAAWSTPSTWSAPRNVKDGQVCVDLFSLGAGGDDVDCGLDRWQVRFTIQNRLSNLAGIAVAEPSVFFRSVAGSDAFGDITAARVDDVTDLSALPDPLALDTLADAPPPGWDSTDWAFGSFGVDLPEAGMAIGPRVVGPGFTATGDTFFLMTSRFDLVRFTVAPVVDGDPSAGLRVAFSSVEASRDDWSAPEKLPEPVTIDIALPAGDDAAWLTFTTPTLVPDAEHLVGVTWPFSPPKATRYDLALARADEDGSIRLLLSPATCVLNATQRAFPVDTPPVTE